MNSFGQIFKVSIFGESHGEGVGVLLDGVPSGLAVSSQDFKEDLEKRMGIGQKGTTPRKEEDQPEFLSGLFNGFTTGAPLTLFFKNKNVRSADYEQQRSIPRPGHVDFVANKKFQGFEDFRGGGHFSARLTTGIVAAGTLAKKILNEKLNLPELHIHAKVIEVAGFSNIEEGLQYAIDQKDSVGGIVSTVVSGTPIGIGEPFWDSVESVLSHALFSIPAVKGVSFGSGFRAALMMGSEHNDAIMNEEGKTSTNHAGGIVGGLSNGNEITFEIAFKPTSSTPKNQVSWNWHSHQMEEFSIKGRHDLCVALRAPVIVEAMTAIVLTDLIMRNLAVPN